jgi:hypothetical protein
MTTQPAGADDSLGYVRDLPGYRPNRPQYFDSEAVDHLIGIVLELGAELWVMRDRQAHLEELLAQKGVDVRAELDMGRPSAETEQRLRAERQAMVKRVYGRLYSRYGGDRVDQTAAL